MDSFMKTLVALGLFVLFVCLGFIVGQEYARNLKKDPAQIHFHYDFVKPPDDKWRTGNSTLSNEMYAEQKYTDEDLDCLARNIYFEAANQSTIGKLAVGLVVTNRVESSRYPDTICDVVNQRSQFSWVNDGKSDTPKDDWAWKDSKKIAKDILDGKADFIDFDHVMHYHADYVSPHWSKKKLMVAQIDQHIFYE